MQEPQESESYLLYKGPCDDCGSSDACCTYSDGHTYCFSCGVTHQNGASPRVEDEDADQDEELLIGEFKDLAKRGIREETCRKFGYKVGRKGDKPVQLAPYRDKNSKVVAQKLRFADKDEGMPWVGRNKKVSQLFGQHLWGSGGKRVVITEGEIDCLSVSQLQDNKWPVVSLINGASGAAKDLSRNAAWLESFDEIVLMFDNDEAGQAAIDEAALVLKPGKVKVARLPLKDANDMLQAGRGGDVIRAIWNAEDYRPDGIKEVDDLIDEACAPVHWGIQWPWDTLTAKTYGIRMTELYAFGGGVGCGKTEVFKELITHLALGLGHRVGVLMLEEPPRHTLKVLAGKVANKRFHVPGIEFAESELREAMQPLRGKVFLYDHFGAKDWDTIKAQIAFMVQAMGIKFIFLDHLTALVAGVDDERRSLDKIMEEMASLAQRLDCAIFFISHLTTPKGTPHEEGGRVHEKDFTGSRAIARWSHFMFGIERNKQEPDQPTCFRILKDRYTGDGNGVTFGLSWDRETGRLEECDLDVDTEVKPQYGQGDNNNDF